MLRTIVIGSCVTVQGTFIKLFADGLMAVRVGSTVYTGRPVGAKDG